MMNDDAERLEMIRYFLAFQNPEKKFPLFSGGVQLRNVAAFMGISEHELTEARKRFEEVARNTATELLSEPEIADQIQQLPFENGQTIVAFGDSLTDDRQGWFEVLRHMLEIVTPNPKFNFINEGISGENTTDAIRRIRRIVSHKPDWVFVAFGTNDAARPIVAPHRTVVSLADFWENVNLISDVLNELVPNPPVWITPPTVVTEMMEDLGYYDNLIHEKDLVEFRQVMIGKPGYVVDPLGTRMGNPAHMWNFMSDGLHHSAAGHAETVREVLKTLTQTGEATPGKQLPSL